MQHRLIGSVVVVAGLLLSGCGGGDGTANENGATANGAADEPSATTSSTVSEAPAFEESEADSVLDYRLVDFAFEGPRTAKGTKVFFKAVNAGSQEHELEVLDPDGEGLGEVRAMPPGASGEVGIELEPGTYTMQCILETPDGKVHKDLGMVAELVVE